MLDTKWKVLKGLTPVRSVAESDVYQLHAYARRYDAPLNVLLYPAVPGVETQTFKFMGTEQLLRLGFVDLNRDLRRDKKELVKELAELLRVEQHLTDVSEPGV